MNTLIFISGMGAGSLLATLILLALMRSVSRHGLRFQTETIALMKERNEIDREKVAALQTLTPKL